MKKERKGRGRGDGGRGGREGGGRGSTIPTPGGKKKKTYGKILYMERKNGKRNRKTKITRNIHQKKKKKTVPPSDDQTYILPGWEKNS